MKRSIYPTPPVWTAPVVPTAGCLLAAGILVGAIGASEGGGAAEWTVLVLALIPVPLALPLLFLRRCGRSPVSASRRRVLLGLMLAVPLCGRLAVTVSHADRLPVAALRGETIVRISGRAHADLRPSSDAIRVLPVRVESVEARNGWLGSAKGRVLLLWRGDTSIATPSLTQRVAPVRGDTIIATAALPAEIPRYLWLENEDLICSPETAWGASIRRSARDGIRRRLARLPPESNAFVTALLLGDRAGMASETVASVRRAGASHVIALSGMHLGVLAVILGAMLRRVGPRWLGLSLVAAALGGYVWVVGWIPSLVRALVLLALLSVGDATDRATVAEISLARCTVIVGVVAPALLIEPGFILSILALLGLFSLAPAILEALRQLMPAFPAMVLAPPIGAMATTAPYSLLTFGAVYPIGILSAGILAVVVVSIMWGALLYLLFATVPLAGSALVSLLDSGVRIFFSICRLVARVPGIGPASGAGVAQTIAWCTLTTAVTLTVVILRRRRRRKVAYVLERYDQPQLDF